MHLRSLALMVFIFAATAALAGFVGIMYDHRALQSPAPTVERELQSVAPAPPGGQDSLSKSATPIGPLRETAQQSTLSSNSTSQIDRPQDIQRPADDSRKPSGLPADPPRAIASNSVPRPKCNIQACRNAYRSFDPADCTYLPPSGPRRTCRK